MIAGRVNTRDVERGLAGVRAAGRNLRGVFRGLRPEIAEDVDEHFEQNMGPDGRWPFRAAASMRKIIGASGGLTKRGRIRAKGRRRVRNQLGRIKHTWKYTVSERSLVGENIVPWSAVHDQGGRVAHGAVIPARRFAWMPSPGSLTMNG